MSMGRAVFRGFRFGMLLQLAIGPVCLFVLQAASREGFAPTEAAVAAVTVVDAAYICAAVAGLTAFLGKAGVKRAMKGFGAAVLCLFGVATILGQFDVNLLPGVRLSGNDGSLFLRALLLTASNPLTILFWAGVFSTKISQTELPKSEVWFFGLGSAAATAVFMTAVAAAGSAMKAVLPGGVIAVLNVGVGAALIVFGIKMAVKKQEDNKGKAKDEIVDAVSERILENNKEAFKEPGK